jgi:phosphotransferase system HPr (HPr) family protein
MSQAKASRTVIVANPEGLHARAATLIAKLAGDLPAKVKLFKGNLHADGTDVLQILSLCALEGEQLRLEATGSDADAALEALAGLFENRFVEIELNKEREPNLGEARPPAAVQSDPPNP